MNIAAAETVLPAVAPAPCFAAVTPEITAETTAETCGRSAALLLGQAQTFKVLAIYQRSAYLSASLPVAAHAECVDDSSASPVPVYNRILCINASALGQGPLQLTTDQFEGAKHKLKPGLRILNDIESATLQFSGSRFINYRRALASQCQQSGYLEKLVESTRLSSGLLSAMTTVSAVDDDPVVAVVADGLFKECIDHLAKPSFALEENHSSAALPGPWHATLVACRADLARLEAVTMEDQRFDGLLAMLGRGSGLTPAGDDFICGVFIALRILGREDQIQVLWNVLEPQLLARTHEISAAHLHQAFHGQIADRSLAVVEALINLLRAQQKIANADLPEDADVAAAITRLSAVCNTIGASSGWDFLAGLLTTLPIETLQYSGSSSKSVI